MEKEFVELLPEITANFSEQKKEQVYKFLYSARVAYSETYNLLKERDIKLTGPEQFIVCTLEPRTMYQALLLYEQMGLIDFMKQNPSLLRNKVVSIMRRMAKCDAINVPYKDENGLVASFIFDGREFNRQVGPLLESKKDLVEPEKEEDPTDLMVVPNDNEKNNRIKDYAMDLLKMFSLDSEENKQKVIAAIDKMDTTNLSEKEVLVNVFTDSFTIGDMNVLTTGIDELLNERKIA